VDLPGEMRSYEMEVVRQAKECFLVCTPDIGSLHMARKKTAVLREAGLHSRVSLIINRVQGKGFSTADVETILQLPVRFTVMAADKEIADATRRGVAIEGRSDFAVQIANIANRIGPSAGTGRSKSRTRRFIEMFSVSPIRDRPNWWSA
jgi:Flp pilus assembly CpaE family ATPase